MVAIKNLKKKQRKKTPDTELNDWYTIDLPLCRSCMYAFDHSYSTSCFHVVVWRRCLVVWKSFRFSNNSSFVCCL